MITRVNIIDKFSTFLAISDSYKFILQWQRDYQLKINIERIIKIQEVNEENLAYEFLTNIRLKPQKILRYHLTSYLQEVCYWATRQVYFYLNKTVNSLTLEECFLWGNEAIITPDKLLKQYQNHRGSKITTYAQTRLKTIIKDKVYLSRGWKLLTNWGLLKRISKSKRQEVLKKMGGLTGKELEEYLLIWQCFVDNYISSSPHRNKSLSSPSISQFKIMTNQYNILAEKQFNFSSILTIEEFENKIKFCGEKARLFVNPITINFPEDKEININDNPQDYLTLLEENEDKPQINHLLTTTFNNLNLASQSIFYLGEGLGLTQQEIIKTIQLTNPNFIKEQSQLSKNINKIRKMLLDEVIKNIKGEKEKVSKEEIEVLIDILKGWITEYIESEILLLCQKSFLEINIYQQKLLQENYFKNSMNNISFIENICPELINVLITKFNNKLNLQLENNPIIKDNIILRLEKFCHQYFNRI
ncbi:MAG: hypothetical protein GW795_05655 [Cyanobacteria bacterium]|nr:hypothetical protein [Cyanobacteria bacterium CG_2015-16_32_12]NCO78821.1 hypothetical protein [Cyanobacteria bacterium CG_2015-22_32_23]NCQ05202.1 hypothetical protein [Cyanobacteria bacterium CG_2015-09_32_10]NCQ41373.1 hypothetical protein [Cyanobacteria bacterium CG_2015-04_32_10]NCS85106.1 hypothetical protein [Cyanobacteria bacterium CG_2015-02_32_10]